MNIINKFIIGKAFSVARLLSSSVFRVAGDDFQLPNGIRDGRRLLMKLILQLFRSEIPEKDVSAATSGVFLIKNYRKRRSLPKRNWLPSRKTQSWKGGGTASSDMMHTFCTSKSYHNKSSLNPANSEKNAHSRVSGKSKSIERLINYLSC